MTQDRKKWQDKINSEPDGTTSQKKKKRRREKRRPTRVHNNYKIKR